MSKKTYRSSSGRPRGSARRFWKWVGLSGVVILIGVAGYALSPKILPVFAPSSRSQQSTPQAGSTAGWRAYTGKIDGYQTGYDIRYPSNVRVYQHPGEPEVVDFYLVGDVPDNASPDGFLYTSNYWYRRLQILYRGGGGMDEVEKIVKQEMTNQPTRHVAFNNAVGLQITSQPFDYFLSSGSRKSVIIRITFGYAGLTDTVPDFQARLKVYKQMLSTFRFVSTP